jgi:SAM-dependent methyltransferase
MKTARETAMDAMIGQYCTPKGITELLARLAERIPATRLLDPACGTGELLHAVARSRSGADVIGVDISKDVLASACSTAQVESGIRFVREDFLKYNTTTLGRFDLVVCNPPFGMRVDQVIAGMRIQSGEAVFIAKSLTLLNDGGYGIFVVPESVLFNEALKTFRQHVLSHHSLEAVVSLPFGQFAPYTGIKTSVLMLRRTDQRPKVFFAQYVEPQALDSIVRNYWMEGENKNPSHGRWISPADLDAIGGLWTYNIVRAAEESKRRRAESKYPVVPLSELVSPIPAKDPVTEPERTLLIQSIGARPNVYMVADDGHLKIPKNVLRCVLTDDRVLPQFLKLYLNSERGSRQLQALSVGVIPSIRLRDLNLVQIELPDIAAQSRILGVHRQIMNVQASMQSIEQQFLTDVFSADRLRPTVERFAAVDEQDIAFERLLWPLATSYRIATKGSPNVSAQLDAYFKMFEQIAAFNSIVLLATLAPDIRTQHDSAIWGGEQAKYAKTSIGLWVGLYRRLVNFLTHLDKDIKATLAFGQEFYANIGHPDILSTLEIVPKMRNKLGGAAHGPVIPEIVAQRAIEELHPMLTKAFARILSAYSTVRLVYPESMRKTDGLYTIRAKTLEGTHYPFAETELVSEADMNTERLYLIDAENKHRLELMPEMIKLIQCEQCGHWSVFFFSKADSKKAEYVSYQNEIHDHTCAPKGLLLSFLRRTPGQ